MDNPDPRTPTTLEINSQYKPFPNFEEWAGLLVDPVRWDRYVQDLDQAQFTPEQLKRAREIVSRAAAIDTGAIEDLYQVDIGFTLTVARQTAAWEAALSDKGLPARLLIESQIEAYKIIAHNVRDKHEITEAFIRSLHQDLCGPQEKYKVTTQQGDQFHDLPLGQYKSEPNHVLRHDGSVHAFAPVDQVSPEMHRLVEELKSPLFQAAHPVLQAAYSHYAFILIHPFADGNGRVARALASAFLYRAKGIPLLILSEIRADYIHALEQADSGNPQVFVDFALERALDALRLILESGRAGSVLSPDEGLLALRKVYTTKGGYTHRQVDEAGLGLLQLCSNEISAHFRKLKDANLIEISGGHPGPSPLHSNDYRMPKSTSSVVSIGMTTPEPAAASFSLTLQVEVPKDCGREDDIVVTTRPFEANFVARASEMIPKPALSMSLRMQIWGEYVAGLAIQSIQDLAEDALQSAGY